MSVDEKQVVVHVVQVPVDVLTQGIREAYEAGAACINTHVQQQAEIDQQAAHLSLAAQTQRHNAVVESVGRLASAFLAPIAANIGVWVMKRVGFNTAAAAPAAPAAPAVDKVVGVTFEEGDECCESSVNVEYASGKVVKLPLKVVDEFTDALFDVVHATSQATRVKVLLSMSSRAVVDMALLFEAIGVDAGSEKLGKLIAVLETVSEATREQGKPTTPGK